MAGWELNSSTMVGSSRLPLILFIVLHSKHTLACHNDNNMNFIIAAAAAAAAEINVLTDPVFTDLRFQSGSYLGDIRLSWNTCLIT